MHEYTLMQRLVETILKNLEEGADFQDSQVKEVRLQVGALDIHSAASFRQAFEVLIRETPLAGAQLNLTVVPASIHCPKCGFQGPCQEDVDGHEPLPVTGCPTCGTLVGVTGGRGIETIELILDES